MRIFDCFCVWGEGGEGGCEGGEVVVVCLMFLLLSLFVFLQTNFDAMSDTAVTDPG